MELMSISSCACHAVTSITHSNSNCNEDENYSSCSKANGTIAHPVQIEIGPKGGERVNKRVIFVSHNTYYHEIAISPFQ